MARKPEATHQITLSEAELSALRTLLDRVRSRWGLRRDIEQWRDLFGAIDKIEAAARGDQGAL